MRNLNIFARLFISHTGMGLTVVVILSVIVYLFLRNTLIQRTVDQLSAINVLEKDLIQIHLLQLKGELEGLREQAILHRFFESANTHEANEEFGNLLGFHGFESLWIYDAAGYVIFSTDSTLHNYLDKTLSANPRTRDSLRLIDATPFVPGQQTTLLFLMPVLGEQGIEGTLVARLAFERIQTILLEQTGMGVTGESYIVGDDFRMRSPSRFFPDRVPYEIEANRESVMRAVKPDGQRQNIVQDYRGVEVLSACNALKIGDVNWVILSEMDLDEAMKPVRGLRNSLIGVTFLLMIVAVMISYGLSTAISKPVLAVRDLMMSLSHGIIPAKRAAAYPNNEIGQMGEAINQLIDAFERSVRFANAIGSGQFDTPYEKLSDYDSLGTALINMRDRLKQFNENEIRLAKSRTAALLEGQELERRRITLDLHDGVGQLLTAIRMRVELVEGNEERKKEIMALINETIAEVRRISYNVMPQALVDYGLKAALEGLCDTIRKYSGVKVDFNYVETGEVQPDFDVSIAIFRIAQEALNNVLKHAGATQVDLHLALSPEQVYLIVADNGQGFDPGDLKKDEAGYGLRNMKERARLLNGDFDVNSTPGQGTVIEVTIPLHPETAV
jgi:signal transduction histidine kinase